MRRFVLVVLAIAMVMAPVYAQKREKLTVYTSFKESMMGELRDAFKKIQPNIDLDYYSAGAGKVMAKIAAERQANNLVADVLWHIEVPDFFALKDEKMFVPYLSPEAKNVKSPLVDPDNEFIAVRLGTMGIVYNTDFIKTPPTNWEDLLKPEYKGAFSIADPALSGTSIVSIGHLVQNPKYGWAFIEKLKANGAKLGQGSGQVVDDCAISEVYASLGVDYIVADKMISGAKIKFAVPKDRIVIPSPIAILKGTKNLSAAQKFIDFMLSKEAQTIIANNLTLPVRTDVAINTAYGLIPVEEAVKQAMKIDWQLLRKEKDATIERVQKLIRGK